MKILIDNQDGNGARDYAPALDASEALGIVRRLNEPTICSLRLFLGNSPLPPPRRNARVTVSGDDGTVYFTGYVAKEPGWTVLGSTTGGIAYATEMNAVSDEVLLDRQLLPRSTASTGSLAASLFATSVSRTGVSALTVSTGQLAGRLGKVTYERGSAWSRNAAAIAAGVRASYRALSGVLSLTPIGAVTHTVANQVPQLKQRALAAGTVRALANDVTVCGAREPVAYATDVFTGDAVTTTFNLSALPFFPPAAQQTLIDEQFNEPAIDSRQWQINDSGQHFLLSSAGLTFAGGTGSDGAVTLTSIDAVEMGGFLTLEAGGVVVGAGCDGYLACLYNGAPLEANCLAGFRIAEVNGGAQLSAIVAGAAAGPVFALSSGGMYTLRLRLHCAEVQRMLGIYSSLGDDGISTYGGDVNTAALQLLMEVQPVANGLTGASTILYDGSVGSAPATCSLVAANSLNLRGSMKSLRLFDRGTAWVVSTPPSGGAYTRRVGPASELAECNVDRSGRLIFSTGSTPVEGERIAVRYRTRGRAVGRVASEQSIAEEATGSVPGTSAWVGGVTQPQPRSSADCENAARALLHSATSISAAFRGTYSGSSWQLDADVWPGEALSFPGGQDGAVSAVVRSVELTYRGTVPDLVDYTIDVANDWAEELCIRTTSSVPADAWIPEAANQAVLDNLPDLAVASLSGNAIGIQTNVEAPQQGGFEVRRRDWAFGPGQDSDLVLRSPVASFVIPRSAAIEQYFIRMFDGSQPPVYSRFSSAVMVNAPFSP